MSCKWATALMLFVGCVTARATIIDFATALPLGNLSQSVTVGGLTVSAFDVSKTTGQWTSNVILNNRAQMPDDLGLGVCSSPANCPALDNGTINEIDNNGAVYEVIRLNFGSVVTVNSLGLSSLDAGDGYAIFGSNSAQPNLSQLTALAQGTSGTSVSLGSSFQYFFATPKNRGVYDTGSNYLLEGVNFTPPNHVNTVPEPQTLTLMGAGLVGIALFLRRRPPSEPR
jgi:PEP-CTERM motif